MAGVEPGSALHLLASYDHHQIPPGDEPWSEIAWDEDSHLSLQGRQVGHRLAAAKVGHRHHKVVSQEQVFLEPRK